jgi:hypothetical protein
MKKTTLICITSCNRLTMAQRILTPYVSFCNNNPSFHFLLALDGQNKAYEDFCADYQIPLLWSDEREGVGLSKNRVISKFPGYDFYFFIDDDAELLNPKIFENMITLSEKLGYHHMSITPLKKIIKQEENDRLIICKGYYGGGYFNFFTKPGLEKVGGWHTIFAKYKRYGHTEHSFRFMHTGLSEYPFIVPYSYLSDILLHDPPHVAYDGTEKNTNELISEEQKMIDSKQAYFPLTTISAFHYNQAPFGFNALIADLLKNNISRYPLLRGREKRLAMSDYYFHLFSSDRNRIKKIRYFMGAFVLNPLNALIKHRIKQIFGIVK